MKFNDELLTDIWNSPVKLNEWFLGILTTIFILLMLSKET